MKLKIFITAVIVGLLSIFPHYLAARTKSEDRVFPNGGETYKISILHVGYSDPDGLGKIFI